LRLSVTDRCNLRCQYCMPDEHYSWIPRTDLLDFEELAQVALAFADHGVHKIRITGGEPLLRNDLPLLVEQLKRIPGIQEVSLTTNGVLFAEQSAELNSAGLDRVTFSLDTLQERKFEELTQRNALSKVLDSLHCAQEQGWQNTKINAVLIRGFNEDELLALLELSHQRSMELRLIEYMDVRGASQWRAGQVYSQADMLAAIESAYGPAEELPGRGPAPAARYRLANGWKFGIISSTTQPFCGACDRSRITADGRWFSCLYAERGIDMRRTLRESGLQAVREQIAEAWTQRADRGAEERLALGGQKRTPLIPAPDLSSGEMHILGG